MRNPKAVTLFTYKPESLAKLFAGLGTAYDLGSCSPDAIRQQPGFADILLFHFSSEQASGLTELQELRRRAPNAHLLVLADSPKPEEVIAIYELKVQGCLMLPVEPEVLLQQLSEVKTRWWTNLLSWLGNPVRAAKTQLPVKAATNQTVSAMEEAVADLYVQFFGEFTIKAADGTEIDLKGTRTQSVLACLLHHRRRGISRNRLIEYFWPDFSYESARNSLNVAICQIRQYLRPYIDTEDPINFTEGRYYVSDELQIHSDFDQFQVHWKRAKVHAQLQEDDAEAEAFQEALAYYHGNFLENMRRQDWTGPIRDNLWETRLYILERLNSYYIHHGRYQEAIANGQQILRQDGCLEKVHRQIMLSYYRIGNRGRALKQYHKCCQILHEELDALPSRETTEVYEMMRRQKMGKLNIALF